MLNLETATLAVLTMILLVGVPVRAVSVKRATMANLLHRVPTTLLPRTCPSVRFNFPIHNSLAVDMRSAKCQLQPIP